MERHIVVVDPAALERLINEAVARAVRESLDCQPRASLTEAQAAEYLSLSRETLRRWRLDGRGPEYQKFGRAVRYDRRALDAWRATNARRALP